VRIRSVRLASAAASEDSVIRESSIQRSDVFVNDSVIALVLSRARTPRTPRRCPPARLPPVDWPACHPAPSWPRPRHHGSWPRSTGCRKARSGRRSATTCASCGDGASSSLAMPVLASTRRTPVPGWVRCGRCSPRC
jgi:hypothetical protein